MNKPQRCCTVLQAILPEKKQQKKPIHRGTIGWKKGHDEGHDGPSLLEQKTVRIIVKTAHFHVTSTPVFLLCVHNSKGAGVIPHSEKLLRRAPVVRMPVGALPGPQRENARKVFFFFLFLFWNIFQQDQRKNSED